MRSSKTTACGLATALIALFAMTGALGCGATYSPNSDLPYPPRGNGALCASCTADSDCAAGGFCTSEDDTTATFCTAPCSPDGSCADGDSCFDIGNGNTGCYPSSGSCIDVLVTTSGSGNGDTSTDGTTGDAASTTGTTSVDTTTGQTSLGTTDTSSTTGTTTGAASSDTTTTAGTTTGTSTAGATTSTSTAGATTSTSTAGATTGTTASAATTTSGSTSTTTHGATSGTTGTTSSTSSTSTGGTTGNTCTADTWASWGKGFFASNCVTCHHHSGSSNLSSQTYVQNNKSSIKSKIDSGSMPEGASLSSADIARVNTYLGCGAP